MNRQKNSRLAVCNDTTSILQYTAGTAGGSERPHAASATLTATVIASAARTSAVAAATADRDAPVASTGKIAAAHTAAAADVFMTAGPVNRASLSLFACRNGAVDCSIYRRPVSRGRLAIPLQQAATVSLVGCSEWEVSQYGSLGRPLDCSNVQSSTVEDCRKAVVATLDGRGEGAFRRCPQRWHGMLAVAARSAAPWLLFLAAGSRAATVAGRIWKVES